MNLCHNIVLGVLQSTVCHKARHWIFSKTEWRKLFPKRHVHVRDGKLHTHIYTWEARQHVSKYLTFKNALIVTIESLTTFFNHKKYRYGSADQGGIVIWSLSLEQIFVWICRCPQHKYIHKRMETRQKSEASSKIVMRHHTLIYNSTQCLVLIDCVVLRGIRANV